jgi:hypothetical protein
MIFERIKQIKADTKLPIAGYTFSHIAAMKRSPTRRGPAAYYNISGNGHKGVLATEIEAVFTKLRTGGVTRKWFHETFPDADVQRCNYGAIMGMLMYIGVAEKAGHRYVSR